MYAPDTTSQPANPAQMRDEPKATILGWSSHSELDVTAVRPGDELTLDPGQPEIVVFFGATSPLKGDVEYRYRLNDYNLDWTVTRERLAHYRRLPPGHYRFEVQAHLAGHPWRSELVSFPIHQTPSFYRTWYFYVLLCLSFVALAMQLLAQHEQLVKGKMGVILDERNRIASDCHDTLMAGFAAISWQLEATAKVFRDGGESETPAAKSCDLARSMVAHCQAEARRIIWDLRDADEVTSILSHALERAMESHRLRDSVQTTFDLQGHEIEIAPGAVHHLVCIGQEAMSNALRHAESSHIAIVLRYEKDSLTLSIRDNGHGFHSSDLTARSGHFGIAVMEERARKLGGTLRLTSAAETGTEVAVTVSFKSLGTPVNPQHHIVPWIGV
jgi:signal transduction histidine kinase